MVSHPVPIISLISLIKFKRSTFSLPCAEGKARFVSLYLILSALSTPKFWQKTVELIEENNAAIKKYFFITVWESLVWLFSFNLQNFFRHSRYKNKNAITALFME